MKTRINDVLQQFRDFVRSDGFDQRPVLTAYVNIDPTNPNNRKERPAWMIELKNEAKQLEDGLDQEKLKRRATQNKWANTEEMVTTYLNQHPPSGRSAVLFTDHSEFVAVDLPLPTTTKLYYGLPQMKEMFFNLDQYKKYLAVLMSGSDVRTIEVFIARTTDELLHNTKHDLAARFGRSGHAHKQDSRVEEYERKFTKEVATELNRYFLADPDVERLVLGGNLKAAHAAKNALHPLVRDKLVAVESIDFKASDNDVAAQVRAIADRFELEHDLTVVDDLVARFNRDGSAVLERQGVEAALSKGLAKTVVIPYPIDSSEFDSLIVQATQTGAEIEFVYDAAAEKLHRFGGVGATLYHTGHQ